MKGATSSLGNKVIIKKDLNNSRPKWVIRVFLLIACVKPYLSLINFQKSLEVLQNFISERELAESGKSTDIPNETGSNEDNISDQVMVKVKEFCRLFTMEMKCHITPVFGCFEFLEISFYVDSNYNIKLRAVDSTSSILTKPRDWIMHKTKAKILRPLENKCDNGWVKCHNQYISNILTEGWDIVLQLHEIGWIRTDKSTFRSVLDLIRLWEKYQFQFLYTDAE